jgi:hypothetical protein
MRPEAETLQRARRAYERGRALLGLRAAALVVPMVILSFGGCGRPATSIAIGCVLATLVAVLTWYGGIPGRGAATGLLAGAASLVAPLVACRALERAGAPAWLPLLACILGGLGSGMIVARSAARGQGDRALFLVAAGAVSALAGSLGCAEVGLGGIAAMAAALTLTMPLGLRAWPGRS